MGLYLPIVADERYQITGSGFELVDMRRRKVILPVAWYSLSIVGIFILLARRSPSREHLKTIFSQ